MEEHVHGVDRSLIQPPFIRNQGAQKHSSTELSSPTATTPCSTALNPTMASESENAAPRLGHSYGPEPLYHIEVDYCPEACKHVPEACEIHVTYDERGGARWRSKHRFHPGSAVDGTIRAPAGDTSGLNYNLYLSSQEGASDQDEIDFEFLGRDKSAVQTNYFVNGVGDHEQMHELPFDSSEDFHHYAIAWDAEVIEWRVDGEVIRREDRQEEDQPWPTKPMYLYASLWNASHVNDGEWTGPYNGGDAPYVCSYKDVRVPMELAVAGEDGPPPPPPQPPKENEEEEAPPQDADAVVDVPEEEGEAQDAGDVLVDNEVTHDADGGDVLVEEEESA